MELIGPQSCRFGPATTMVGKIQVSKMMRTYMYVVIVIVIDHLSCSRPVVIAHLSCSRPVLPYTTPRLVVPTPRLVVPTLA